MGFLLLVRAQPGVIGENKVDITRGRQVTVQEVTLSIVFFFGTGPVKARSGYTVEGMPDNVMVRVH